MNDCFKGKSVHKAGGQEADNEMAKTLQWDDGLSAGPDVLYQPQSHELMHSPSYICKACQAVNLYE